MYKSLLNRVNILTVEKWQDVCFLHFVILLSSKICSPVFNGTVALDGNLFLRMYALCYASNCKNWLAV